MDAVSVWHRSMQPLNALCLYRRCKAVDAVPNRLTRTVIAAASGGVWTLTDNGTAAISVDPWRTDIATATNAATTIFNVTVSPMTLNQWAGFLRRYPNYNRPWTPEEQARRAMFDREREARRIELMREHEVANARAEILLQEHLTAQQKEELRGFGFFQIETISPQGQRRRYRIRRGRSGNIEEVNAQGQVVNRLCVHPTLNVPDADTMLAQKLWLETAEEELRRTANITRCRG